RLGEGHLQDLSLDGRSVLALEQDSRQLLVIPTGAGQTKRIPIDASGFQVMGAGFLPGDRGFCMSARSLETNEEWQAVGGIEGGKPRMFRAEGYASRSVAPSPDGQRLAYQTTGRHVRLLSLIDGGTTAVPTEPLGETTEIITWSEDDRYLYLAHYGVVPLQ